MSTIYDEYEQIIALVDMYSEWLQVLVWKEISTYGEICVDVVSATSACKLTLLTFLFSN